MRKEELIEKLDQWIRRSRRDESAFNIIWHIDDESAYQEIVARLKIKVAEEWIQEKTVELIEIISKGEIGEAMSFIRSLFKEIHGRK